MDPISKYMLCQAQRFVEVSELLKFSKRSTKSDIQKHRNKHAYVITDVKDC